MAWFSTKIVDLFTALSNFYYSKKYGTLLKQAGLREEAVAGRRGFIIIQIDGLSYEHLSEAMARGYAPHMKRLVEKGGAKLARWRCGLPSTTPAVQAGIMFGNNFDIPAFRWYEKETRTHMTCNRLGQATVMQNRISTVQPGILEGGSSYMNIMDGGARLSLFTLSALSSQQFFENVRGLGFFLLFLLSPLRVARVVLLSLREYLLYLFKRLLTPKYHRPPSIFLQVVNNVLLREIQTFACLLDVYRGMPAIYINYNGYDEVAHYCRPSSTEALKALRIIDRQIKQIDHMIGRCHRREYDLYILSDHGMTLSLPFKDLYGCQLGEYIAKQTGEAVFTDEKDGEGQSALKAQFLLSELEEIEKRLPELGATLIQAARRYIEDKMALDPSEREWNLDKQNDIVVKCSGSLAHVYFNITSHRMDLSEIAALYPSLLTKLIAHPGIGLVVGREGEEVVIVSKEGALMLSQKPKPEEKNPLHSLPEPEIAAAELQNLASFPHSGDLILLGAWHGNPIEVVCFENQMACHGGLAGPQDYPFIIYPSKFDLHPEKITNARQWYPHFATTYKGGGREPPLCGTS